MSEYIIKNGHVFDPVQGIKGDKKDIHVKDGKIVESVGSGAKVIDASGKTVMAGALEIHAHVAGPKVNAATHRAASWVLAIIAQKCFRLVVTLKVY